jgi:hypothetical protein
MIGRRIFLAGMVGCVSLESIADSNVKDKSQYHLFNPVPKELMNDMSPDRPDKTEGAFVLDAGHFQFEFDALNYTVDRNTHHGSNEISRTLALFAPTIRVGLINKLELNLILSGFNRVRTKDYDTNQHSTQNGYGDTVVRFKYNFWGNDGNCKTAFAAIPFVKFATNQDHLGNSSVEQGIAFPLDVKITDKLHFDVFFQVNATKGHGHGKRVAEFVQSAELNYQFTEKLSGFAEIFTDKNTDGGAKWIVTGDCGFSYALTDNVMLDTGVSVGMSKEADDLNITMGISFRI